MAIRVELRPVPSRTHKNCPQCRLLLPIEKFWTSKESIDGHQGWCKKCDRARKRVTRNA